MSERVTVSQAAALLREADRILILTHHFPDGDTLGSGYALCRALRALGKQARVVCNDAIPEKYAYRWEGMETQDFEPAFVCAVDVADEKLLGETLQPLAAQTELCIDHHGSHRPFEKRLLLDAAMGANAMIILQVIEELGVTLDVPMADCLYTGIATDTGCFKYSNTTPLTHRMAAQLMEVGAHAEPINRAMFDIKSRARLSLEQQALQSMTFYAEGRIAVMKITEEMLTTSGACEGDLEGLSPLPRQIEGVWVGATLRRKEDGSYKVSIRTGAHADASEICALLGGGGHARAAGCTLSGSDEAVLNELLGAIKQAVPRLQENCE